MDVIELLVGDHNRVRGLMARYKSAEKANEHKEAIRLGKKIVSELRIHIEIEEEVFYPVVHEISETLADEVGEGTEEHHVVKVLMDEMDAITAGSDEWIAKMTVVNESTDHHLKEEEEEMFPKVRSHTAIERRSALGDAFEQKKKDLGVPTFAEMSLLTKTELEALAKDQEIPGRSKMDHDQLAATVGP